MVQGVTVPTHILRHTWDALIAPCDSDFVQNVRVGDFIFDHAIIRCQWDFSWPATSTERLVSYCQYHKIDTDHFCNELNNIPFVLSPGETVSELHDQYVNVLTHIHSHT